jgi:hypothetical protein
LAANRTWGDVDLSAIAVCDRYRESLIAQLPRIMGETWARKQAIKSK